MSLSLWYDEARTSTFGTSRRLSGLDLVKHFPAFYCADRAHTIGLYNEPEESTPQSSIVHFFYVFLTVQLNIILVNDQLNAQTLVF